MIFCIHDKSDWYLMQYNHKTWIDLSPHDYRQTTSLNKPLCKSFHSFWNACKHQAVRPQAAPMTNYTSVRHDNNWKAIQST